jgi:hypothetical protein
LKQQIAALNTLKADVEALKTALKMGNTPQVPPSVSSPVKASTERK